MRTKRTNIFVIIFIILSAAVILYALFGHGTYVDTASVTLPPPVSGGESQNTEDNENQEIVFAEVTPKTVQSVIRRTLSRAESYSRTITVSDFWDGGESSTELFIWVDNGSTRIRLDSGSDIKNILLTDGQLFIWYDNKNGVYTASTNDSKSEADVWLRCLTYEDVLSLPVSSITGAGYIEYAGESCIYAEYNSDNFGYLNVVYVSVNTGLLMGAETFDGDTCIYRMTSGTPDISAPNSHMFTPPKQSSES